MLSQDSNHTKPVLKPNIDNKKCQGILVRRRTSGRSRTSIVKATRMLSQWGWSEFFLVLLQINENLDDAMAVLDALDGSRAASGHHPNEGPVVLQFSQLLSVHFPRSTGVPLCRNVRNSRLICIAVLDTPPRLIPQVLRSPAGPSPQTASLIVSPLRKALHGL